MPVEEEGALVHVRVAAEDEVHTRRLEDRIHVLAHLDELDLRVRVVRAFRVRRVVPVRDDPSLRRGREVGGEPREHGTAREPAHVVRVEAHEVDVSGVEGVVRLGPRRDPAGFGRLREAEEVEVDACPGAAARGPAVVIPERGPERHRGELGRERPEHRGPVLGVRARDVRVVAEHQPEVGAARAGVAQVRVAHGPRARVGRPRIADDPDAERCGGVCGRRRHEGRGGRGRERPRGGSDPVVVAGPGREARHGDGVLGHGRGVREDEGKRRGTRSQEHPAVHGHVRAPADEHGGGGRRLEVRAARHGQGERLPRGEREDGEDRAGDGSQRDVGPYLLPPTVARRRRSLASSSSGVMSAYLAGRRRRLEDSKTARSSMYSRSSASRLGK